jgi:hypothetical protein
MGNCTKHHTNRLVIAGTPHLLTVEEKKNIHKFPLLYMEATCGCWLSVRANGKVQTWKRDPSRVKIPAKYGLYEYFYITETTPIAVPN